jgi:hypothetical protein
VNSQVRRGSIMTILMKRMDSVARMSDAMSHNRLKKLAEEW